MWAKIITIKRTKYLNYFSLCALNLFNTRVSQFEFNYWNKWTFPWHSNLLRCTCKYTHTQGLTLTRANPPNAGGFQLWQGNTVTPTSHSGVLHFIKPTVTELDINMCLRQVHFFKWQVKEEDITCLTRQLIWLKHLTALTFRREWF